VSEFKRCVLLLVLLPACLAGCARKNESEPASSADTGTAAVVSPAAPGATEASKLAALVDVIVEEAGKLPREEFDPAALSRKLGKDPNVQFAWVRDNTWWAPYRGLLRGSKGVILDRVGSSLDRAVLLADLLRLSGHTVRFVHAELPDADAVQLQGKLRPIPDRRRDPTPAEAPSTKQIHVVEAALPQGEPSLAQQVADSKRKVDEARALGNSQYAQLYAAVKSSAHEDQTAGGKALVALQDHWWVERQENGEWIAMDLLLPNTAKRTALKNTTRTSVWSADQEMPPIPEADWHAVQMRVVIERYEKGTTSESVVLNTELRPAEIIDRPVVLAHLPKPWPENPPDTRADPNSLGNAAVAVKEWMPFLLIGDRPVAQSAFTDDGQLVSDPMNPERDITDTGGAGFMSGFSEALGGGGETSSSSVTAEWIDYEIRVPGELPQPIRRPLFDLLGPAGRLAKVQDFDASTNERLVQRYEALLATTNILLQPCEFSEEYLAHLLTRSLVANQAAIKDLARERDPAKARNLASTLLGSLDHWGALPALAVWRSALTGESKDWFIDRPNVLNYRLVPRVVNGDQPVVRATTDIASNSIGVRRDASRGSFEVRLRQGIVDTIAEMFALGSEVTNAENTSSLFKAAGTGPDVAVSIKRGDPGAAGDFGFPENVAARLAASVDAGYVAVVLREPVPVRGSPRFGWWRVDPTSGETIGVMDTGLHGDDTAEYSAIRLRVLVLKGFLAAQAGGIAAARALQVLTPGQSLLIRAADAAEAAIALANSPFIP
jgi:hypothetical protein